MLVFEISEDGPGIISCFTGYTDMSLENVWVVETRSIHQEKFLDFILEQVDSVF